MAEATPIGQNYATDYSPYYLDFAASLGSFGWEDFGGGAGDFNSGDLPGWDMGGDTATTTSTYTRTQSIQNLRDAAKRLAAKRGITIRKARTLLRSNERLRVRWMGEEQATAWSSRKSATGEATGDGAAYADIIAGLGLADGLFQPMIDKAIRNGWSAERLRAEILQSPQFEYLFPGIKRADGSLRMSAMEYRQVADSYVSVAKEFGIALSRDRVGYLINGAVSPQEFYQRVAALDKVRVNSGLRETFNEQLAQFGLKPLDEQGWFKFLAGVGGKDYYDVYEAAQLRNSGLNIDASTAKGVAQNIGEAGAPIDIQSLVSEARTMLADIGPELLREGITDADLIQMAAGYDPRGLEPKLRTIMANRRATGAFVMGSRPVNSGSATTVFTPEEAAAY